MHMFSNNFIHFIKHMANLINNLVNASRPIGLGSEFPGFSFSQPISTDNMILNSQIQVTQNPNSQYASQSQSPFLKLGK